MLGKYDGGIYTKECPGFSNDNARLLAEVSVPYVYMSARQS